MASNPAKTVALPNHFIIGHLRFVLGSQPVNSNAEPRQGAGARAGQQLRKKRRGSGKANSGRRGFRYGSSPTRARLAIGIIPEIEKRMPLTIDPCQSARVRKRMVIRVLFFLPVVAHSCALKNTQPSRYHGKHLLSVDTASQRWRESMKQAFQMSLLLNWAPCFAE